MFWGFTLKKLYYLIKREAILRLKYLTTFKTITVEGSFVKAAEKLNYTQSAITFHVQLLEEELSTQLFEKHGRRRVLTKAGEQFIPYVDEVLASIGKMQFFKDDVSKCQGDLHIGIAETQLCYRIPHILRQFHRTAPKAKLFLRSMNCYDIRDDLINGVLDLGIFYKDVGGFGSHLTIYPLGEFPVILVASPDLKRQFPDFITPDRHIPVSFIINEHNCVFRQIFEKYLKDKAIQLDHTIELWSIPTIKNLVLSNLGISFLPKFAVQEELDREELVEIPTEMINTRISAACCHLKDKWISPLMKEFINLCAKNY